MQSSRNPGRLAGPLAALLAPVVLAFGILYHFAQQVPIIDDYATVVRFSLRYLELRGAWPRLEYIVASQHNEYKFVLEHLVVGADLTLTHHLHFAALLLIGNLFLLAIAALLWNMAREPGQDLWQRMVLFVPVSLLMFGLNYAEAVNFPSASLDYLPAIFFSFAAIVLLTREQVSWARFGLACVCALLAYASAVNAFLLWPLGVLILLPARRWGRMAVWSGVLAVGLVPYFYHYTRINHPVAKSISSMPLFLLAFLGSGGPVHQLAMLLGAALVGIFAWGVWNGARLAQPAIFWCGVWVVLSGAMTAYGRSALGVALAQGSRYRIFSDLLVIFCYLILLRVVLDRPLPAARKVQLYWLTVGVALVFFVRADRLGWQFLAQRQADVRAGAAHFLAAPGSASPMYFANAEDERGSQAAEALAREDAVRAQAVGLYPMAP